MLTSSSIQKLSAALVKAQGQLSPVEKDGENPFYHHKYTSLASVIDASKKPLADNGLAIVQFPVSIPGEVGVTTTVLHESGEWMSDTVMIPIGSEGRNPAQNAGIVISYLRRYAWKSVLGMQDEDTDGEPVSVESRAEKEGEPVEKEQSEKVWLAEQLASAMDAGLFKHPNEAKNALAYSNKVKPGVTGPKSILYWSQVWRKIRTDEPDLPLEQVGEKADWELEAEINRRKQDKAHE